jgi:hypothetical protein
MVRDRDRDRDRNVYSHVESNLLSILHHAHAHMITDSKFVASGPRLSAAIRFFTIITTFFENRCKEALNVGAKADMNGVLFFGHVKSVNLP